MARRAGRSGANPWLLERHLAALPRVVKEGGKLPESINGRLATRVALSYDTLANLHQQLGNALQGLKGPTKTG
jgi:hypothetical protein